MPNFGAKILNNAKSALSAQQAVIATASNNIANVNTPGYARRVVDLETRQASSGAQLNVGDGVQIGHIQRVADDHIEKALREAISEQSGQEIEADFLGRVDALFDLTGQNPTIGNRLTAFFTAINTLSADPSNLELRSQFIAAGQDLVDTIKTTYNALATLQNEADERIANEVDTVNSLAAQIAALNPQIASAEVTGNTAADLRDQRGKLLEQLSEKIGYNHLELPDGSIQLTLDGGFPLVNGSTSRTLEVSKNPSYAGGSTPNSLSGGKLNYIVYDFSNGAGTAHVDLTQDIQDDGGTLGGLLKVRGYNDVANTSPFEGDGALVEVATRIEALTQELLTNFNNVYFSNGVDENTGSAGTIQSTAGDLNGTQLTNPYSLFGFTYGGTLDFDADGRADDLANITTASGITSFSSLLTFNTTDPRNVATARDLLDTVGGSTSFAPGDNRVLQDLAALQTNNTLSFSAGPTYSFTGTFEQQYNDTVTKVSNLKSNADLGLTVAQDSYLAAANRRDEESGVSLDEEFTGLIKFQKAYEASARMIKIADSLLEQILNLI